MQSVRYIVDTQNATIVQETEYDEYGNFMKNTNQNFQPLAFAGGLYDQDTKFICFGAHDYDPTTGRWTTKDPIGFDGGDTNLYAYIGGNPMSFVDPDGEAGIPGVIVGAGVEIALQVYALRSEGKNVYDLNNYNWTNVGISAIFGGLAPGLLNVAKTTKNSVGAIRALSTQITKAKSLNRVAKISARIAKNQSKIKSIVTTQATFQGLKYIAKKTNHAICE